MEPKELALKNPQELANVINAADRFIEASRSPATRRTYAADWRIFEGWCEARGLSFLPASPGTVMRISGRTS